jgi:tRNA pseudouridine55 synthase
MDLHGILIVDKPRGITSHDVVARVRRLLQTRKVGHAGTLDPAAQGVMILGIGRATKLLGALTGHSKHYAAHVVLGVGSESGDIEGPLIVDPVSCQPLPEQTVRDALTQFLGDIEQIPPAHAAIKVDGQPMYRYARRGSPVEVPCRRVRIETLDLIDYRFPHLYLDVRCSAGTYIRSLARDLGDALGTSAYLHALLRTDSGRFSLTEAWALEELERGLRPETFEQFALHPALAETEAAAVALGPNDVNAWYDGRPVATTGRSDLERAHAFQIDGFWLGVGSREGGFWQPKMVVHG